jgi:amino acid adenylation domain-containing protein
MTEKKSLDHLAPEKLDRLLKRLRERRATRPAAARIERRADRVDPRPPSFAQERLWFLDRLDPGSGTYNIPAAFRLRGRLSPALLARCFGEIARRHEALRTRLPAADGAPVQSIAPPAPARLPVVDLGALPAGGREAVARRVAVAVGEAPFDLQAGPLTRFVLLRGLDGTGGEDLHLLVASLHHTTADGWSVGVLARELVALYQAFSAGAPSPLPELPIQYADYALWQRERVERGELAGEESYWRERLTGAPETLELPADRPRRGAGAHRGGRRPVVLRTLPRVPGERTTPFMALLAGVGALLARYTGADDLVVGSPIANRSRAEVEGLIGLFVNTLALRLDLAGDPSFTDLLGRVRATTLEAYDRQDLPFERVVEAVQPERSLGRSPLFQVFLVFQNAPAPRFELGGLEIAAEEVEGTTAKFDLSLILEPVAEGAGSGARGFVEYDAELFDPATVDRLIGHLENVLDAAADEPSARISALRLLGAGEERQILEEWSGAGRDVDEGEVTLHQRVRERARAIPEAIAVVAGGESLSYGELVSRAARLAARLRDAGAGPESRIGVLVPRGADLVVAVLGVLEAGAAYVPLDPSYPVERIAFQVEDSRGEAGTAVVVVGPDGVPEELSTALGGRIRRVPVVPGNGDEPPAVVEPAPVLPDQIAYVIYTSGSTGRPKGVAISHRAAGRLVTWALTEFSPREIDRVLAATSICFDLSVFELFVPLAGGGSVHLVDDALALAGLPGADRVTLINTVPSAAGELVRLEALPASVLTVNLAGEPLRRALADRIFGAGRVERLLDLYGPSEEATYSTWSRVDPESDAEPTIGRPVDGTRARVVDRRLSVQPAGVPGELCLSGAGLARGYLGRPARTAESFVPDPFAPPGAPGGRLYRTGDLARWRPVDDGAELEFLGRLDHQVKVRGFRIELGEIEAALTAHPMVSDAVVLTTEPPGAEPGATRLIAYAEVTGEPSPPLAEHLRSSLPAQMVPALFVTLDVLPRTPNGKIDRKALPAPEMAARRSAERVAPSTPTEELLAGLWEELLGIDDVGAGDSFFDLGGHSLLATRLIARLRSALGVDLPVRQVFETPTVAELAAVIEASAAPAALPPPEREASDTAPLSFSQERLWFLDRLDPGDPTYNLPTPVDLRGELRLDALRAAFDALVRRQEALRTSFEVVRGQPHQRIHPPAPVPLPVVDLGGLPAETVEEEAERLTAERAARRFDLTRTPLFDALVVRLAPRRHRLLLVAHHIVTDGWSMGVMVRDLGAAYAAAAEGRDAALPELPIQYGDVARWQRRSLAGAFGEQLAYWRERLGGEVPPLDLPTDRPRPAIQTYEGAVRTTRLDPELVSRLRELERREGATRFMTLAAAAQAVLGRHAGQDEVLFGTPIAGRRLSESESLVGFFLNTLVLRIDRLEASSFRQLVARVRERTLEAYSNQDVPFEAVLAEVTGERDLSRTPLFQVLFNVLNFPAPELDLPGLELEIVSMPELPSKFDLTFYVAEEDDGVRIDLAYNSVLFDAARIDELLRQLRAFLDAALAAPDRPHRELSLVTPEARDLLPDPTAPLDDAWIGTVHELFCERAREAPDRAAVVDPEGVWSYGVLERASGELAGRLAALGVERGGPVAILAHRSSPLVLAILGALRAGGAFTMLDPAYPAVRLVEMLELASPRAFVRLAAAGELPELVAAWLERARCPVVTLPPGAAALTAAGGAEPPAPDLGPDDLAHVAFTSGSTGTPKGILGRHGPLSHFLPWQCGELGLTADDRFSLLSGLAHDPLQRDLFTPLFLGAAIHVPDPADIPRAGRLAAWLARDGVTVAHLTPAMGQLLTEPPAGDAPAPRAGLRRVLLVGDALTRLDVARIEALAPGVECVNLYGSTETQRAVAYHRVRPTGPPRGGGGELSKHVLPLGRGMRDVQLLVLARSGGLAGIGELGEIAVRSPHLCLGYLGDEPLTAERFVTNPFTGESGDRIYRTGDLGRYLPDGEVTFAGRVDDQVKIRGFRIEPAEIQASLALRPEVREAVVLALPHRGGRRLVAYLVPEEGAAVDLDELRRDLRETLPVYMVPAAFAVLERLPLTPNGKVDRRALARLEPRATPGSHGLAPETALERRIASVWREVLGVERIGVGDNFFDLGGHSLLLVRLHARLQEELGRELSLIDLFAHPTVRAQAAHLVEAEHPAADGGMPEPVRAAAGSPRSGGRIGSGDVAVVGMAGRFPGADDVDVFWRNLRAGLESICHFSEHEVVAAGVDPVLAARPDYVRARGVLEGADLFDAGFFGYSPREAELTDPQQRLFLECAWHALEDAGHDPSRFPGEVGVYGGVTLSTYFLENLYPHFELLEEVGGYQAAIGTDRDFLTTQVSYKLDLAGPSVDVQTACSTSLVAVHLACRALRSGECDMALAGGVSVKVPQTAGYLYTDGGIDSPDGSCRAFDAEGRGTVWGSGLGIVVLRRLEDALADGDPIRAVIRGTAINNDGADKVGYTAPSVEGQAAVIAAAQEDAGVAPESIGYVEAHGTGTELGDPAEVAALERAFRRRSREDGEERDRPPIRPPVRLGSVKTNLGHLGAAAGVTGLIKAVLALEREEIPPSLHFERPNPRIDLESGPFRVAAKLEAWPRGPVPRRAGVSSFGLGGTNAHAILEEAPAPAARTPARPWPLLVLSARSETALDSATDALAGWLEARPGLGPEELSDLAHTLQIGRKAFDHRRIVAVRDASDARRALGAGRARRTLTGNVAAGRPRVVFLYPGQGAQHPGMARQLHRDEPVFRDALDRCFELLGEALGAELRTLLLAEGDPDGGLAVRLTETRHAQPALLAVEHALTELWASWGVRPAAILGHSLGEYGAATAAGVLSLADALALVTARGEMMHAMPAGAMLSVAEPEDRVAERLEAFAGLAVAAVNSPGSAVVSGTEAAIAAFAEALDGDGVEHRRVVTSHAFHSAMMDPVLGPYAERVSAVELRTPEIPFLSNLTGDWITAEQATDPAYWAHQLRGAVRFGDGLGRLLAEDDTLLLEVGPGRTLGSLARRRTRGQPGRVVSSLPHPRDTASATAVCHEAAGRLWIAGAEIEWRGLSGPGRRRVRLPGYPFERARYWIGPGMPSVPRAAAALAAGQLYAPVWRPARLGPRPEVKAGGGSLAKERWLLVLDEAGIGEALAGRLMEAGGRPIVVRSGERFGGDGESGYTVDLDDPASLDELFRSLADAGDRVDRAVSLEPVTRSRARALPAGRRGRCFMRLYRLAAALAGAAEAGDRVDLCVVSTRLHEISGGPTLAEIATLLAACRSIPLELPAVGCRSIDLPVPRSRAASSKLAERLLGEIARGTAAEVAYQGSGQRWVRTLEPAAGDRSAPVAGAPGPSADRGARPILIGDPSRFGTALDALYPGLVDGAADEASGDGSGRPLLAVIDTGPAAGEDLDALCERALSSAAETLDALRGRARSRTRGKDSAPCVVLTSPAGGAVASAAAAYAGRLALGEAIATRPGWRSIQVDAPVVPGSPTHRALARALELGSMPELVIVPPPARIPASTSSAPPGGIRDRRGAAEAVVFQARLGEGAGA